VNPVISIVEDSRKASLKVSNTTFASSFDALMLACFEPVEKLRAGPSTRARLELVES
jgi:hypothetical protein